jgi:TolB-like protein/Flp pilus assembly protein TadD/predicted Ser/Thr protein kinase
MIGTSLGQYRIDAVLGEGGMGTVYRARDTRLEREVAIKLLTTADEPGERESLLHEARAAARISHPAIATVYEVAELDDTSFIVMELVEGAPLTEHVGKLKGDGLELSRLAIAALKGLGAAHGHGIVHGDVKPDNLMICPDGSLKILDFGVSRHMSRTVQKTIRSATSEQEPSEDTRSPSHRTSDQIIGTIAYMPPEQMRGEEIDGRADLYSLGIVLQELATGRRPFAGSSAHVVVARALTASSAVLDELRQHQPPQTVRVIERLLALDPSHRHGSAEEATVDFEMAISDLDRLGSGDAKRTVVVVLPFRMLAEADDDGFLGVGLAQAVAHRLAGNAELLVRPMSAVLGFGTELTAPRRAASELSADLVVEGTIQRLSDRMRIQVQAWEAGREATLFSAQCDGDMDDLFELQDRLSHEIEHGLGASPTGVAASGAAGSNAKPGDGEAYELYMRAGERILRMSDYDVRGAIEQLERCVSLQPEFSDAWARLAGAQLLMAVILDPHEKWYVAADRSVDHALALDPGNPDAWVAKGRLLWSPRAGFVHGDGLRYLNAACHHPRRPHDAAVWYAIVLGHVGLHDEAMEWLEQALEDQPDDALAIIVKGEVASYMGNFDQAAETYLRLRTIDPGNIFTRMFLPVGLAYIGEFDAASKEVNAARRLHGEDALLSGVEGLIEALRGDSSRAAALVSDAITLQNSASHFHHTLHYASAASAVLGEEAQAVALLRQAADSGLPNYPAFKNDPHLRSLAGNSEFVALMSDLETQWHHFTAGFGADGRKIGSS